MLTSLRAHMGLLLLAFFGLVSISAMATFWAIDAQKKDGLVINLAGRQRMLVQQMSKDALWSAQAGDKTHVVALEQAADTFEQTLSALIAGGQAPYISGRTVDLPATHEPHILSGLEQVRRTWDTFRGHLHTIATTPPASLDFEAAVQAVQDLSPALAQQTDEVVRLYEDASASKIAQLRRIQVAFFAGALLLLAVGSLVTYRSVVKPLHELASAAGRIGRGDLDTPVESAGPQEVEHLAHDFDAMRSQLKSSQEALETRVVQRTREMEALHEISREISSRLELHHVLRSVTDKARELLGAEVAFLCLLDETQQDLHLKAISGPPQAVRATRAPARRPPAEQVLAGERALPCGLYVCNGTCAILAAPFGAGHLAAPLRIGERVMGALCVGSANAGAFGREAPDLLTRLAGSAAIALENAHLYEQAERVAALEERQRIAAEMHDGLAQTLSYLRLRVGLAAELIEAGDEDQTLAHLYRLQETIGQAAQELRCAIADLRTQPKPDQTLQERLAAAVQEFAGEGQPAIELVVAHPAPLRLAADETEQVLRVVGEALHNACRHAQAGRVIVRLSQQGGQATLQVEDDGRGFDPALLSDGDQHFGLSIMRARAASIGGQLSVQSTPGQGTRVTLAWATTER